MIDIVTMIAVLLAGLLLGCFFFGGLLWTVGRGLSAKYPALWFLGSFLIRIAVVLTAFYFLSNGRWEQLIVCAAGFFIARIIIIRFARIAVTTSCSRKEAGDAS